MISYCKLEVSHYIPLQLKYLWRLRKELAHKGTAWSPRRLDISFPWIHVKEKHSSLLKAVTRFLNLSADTSATNQNRYILHHYFWYLWFSLDKRQLILPLFILWCNWRLFYTPKKSIMTQREWNTTGMFYGCLLCVVELWAFFHTGSGVLGFAHRPVLGQSSISGQFSGIQKKAQMLWQSQNFSSPYRCHSAHPVFCHQQKQCPDSRTDLLKLFFVKSPSQELLNAWS